MRIGGRLRVRRLSFILLEKPTRSGIRKIGKGFTMKHLILLAAAVTTTLLPLTAFADWYKVDVKYVMMKTDSAEPAPGPRIIIYGIFTPALPCAVQGFTVLKDDPMFSATFAM